MQNTHAASFMEATGVIKYNMTNNYMFRYILQQNKKVLTGLICSLLHLKPEQIKSIEITNPIDLAGDITGKEFILDINVMLNDDTLINLEMRLPTNTTGPNVRLCISVVHLTSSTVGKSMKKHFLSTTLDFLISRYSPNILNFTPLINYSILKIIIYTVANLRFLW